MTFFPICLECKAIIWPNEKRVRIKKGYIVRSGKRIKVHGYIHLDCPFGGETVEDDEE